MKKWLVLVVLLYATSICAQQSMFKKAQSEDSILLSYQWQDQFLAQQELAFSFSLQAYQSQFSNQTSYQPSMAQRYVYVSMMKQAKSIDPKQAHVELRKVGSQVQIKVRSRSQEMVDKFTALMEEKQDDAFNQYLADHYYTLIQNYAGETGVIPDHVRYVQESKELLLPVAQAIYDTLEPGSDTRDYVNLLLSWIQTIPYDPLQNRFTTNGSGYSNPMELLINNKGDCDSKATLMAALLRALLPNMSIAIVYLPEHALLAVNLSHRSDEMTLDVRGTPHVLLEPTGPALLTMGNVSERTAQAISTGKYSSKIVP